MGARRKWVTRGAGSRFGNSGTDYGKGPLPASNAKSIGLPEGKASQRPALSQRTREGRGTRVLCIRKAWASPLSRRRPSERTESGRYSCSLFIVGGIEITASLVSSVLQTRPFAKGSELGLPSPPAKRTDHLLTQPDISCANDSRQNPP
jgi:hypothetical protein